MTGSKLPTRIQASSVPSAAASDKAQLQGLIALLADGALGITNVVEAMHGTISRVASPLSADRPQQARGIAGLVYRAVRGGMRGSAWALDAVLDRLPLGESTLETASRSRLDALAVLNGVLGDHLERAGNPLALPMSFQCDGQTLELEAGSATSKRIRSSSSDSPPQHVLLCIHGLCLHDGHWSRDGQDHGEAIARALNWTPLYLRYNTGRSIAANGERLADQLELLLQHWPRLQLHVLAHSMGGLVMRSAIHHADPTYRWPQRLRSVSFLGTPHAGAPLERAGNQLDRLLDISPYSAPFVRLGAARSEGIIDLRHGRIADGPRDTHSLPPTLPAFTIAATLGSRVGSPKDLLLGDGLVPVASALGTHGDLDLEIPRSRRRVVANTGHIELLSSETVQKQLLSWLRPLSKIARTIQPTRKLRAD